MEQELKKIYRTVRDCYRCIADEAHSENSDEGFAILHEPVTTEPPILVIGENPGRESCPKRRKQDMRYRPNRPKFLAEDTHRYAFVAQALFSRVGATDLLASCQSTDANFFRSKVFQSRDNDNFCFDILEEIIQLLQPQKIVVTGQESYKKLARAADIEPIPHSIGYGPKDQNQNPFNRPLIVVPHFSRTYAGDAEHFRTAIPLLQNFLSE